MKILNPYHLCILFLKSLGYSLDTFVSKVSLVKDKTCFIIYITVAPINDTTFELSVFCPADTESPIKELRFSDSIKTRPTSVTSFWDVT